jgi:hypothetical protein
MADDNRLHQIYLDETQEAGTSFLVLWKEGDNSMLTYLLGYVIRDAITSKTKSPASSTSVTDDWTDRSLRLCYFFYIMKATYPASVLVNK